MLARPLRMKHLRLAESAQAIASEGERPRPSASVKAVAETLSCDQSTVRKMIRKGTVESWKLGGAVRVYLDSVAAYQERQTQGVQKAARKENLMASGAAHREALAHLRGLGCL